MHEITLPATGCLRPVARLRRGIATAALALLAAGAAATPAASASAPSLRAAASGPYAKQCQGQSTKRVAGSTRTRYAKCVIAMTRLARAETRSPRSACAALPDTRGAGSSTSPRSRCVKAGAALIRDGNGLDRAFVDEMIPHHVAAVQMAQLALTQGQSDFIRTLAGSIISSQNVEIETMRRLSATLAARGMKAVDMGLTRAQMGMDHDMSHLAGAVAFDVDFVDMMIPHHQGAITMSSVLFERGVSPATRALAQQITAAQATEIEAMRAFRVQVTGSSEPAPDDHPH